MLARDVTIKFVDPQDGSWLITRDILNDRGDEATIQERCRSVEEIGIVDGIRSGCWVVPAHDNHVSESMRCTCLHGASLVEGTRMAYEKPSNSGNMQVHLSVRAGLRHSTVFRRDTPDSVKVWIKELGNITNENVTRVTLLEVYRSCETVEGGPATDHVIKQRKFFVRL